MDHQTEVPPLGDLSAVLRLVSSTQQGMSGRAVLSPALLGTQRATTPSSRCRVLAVVNIHKERDLADQAAALHEVV